MPLTSGLPISRLVSVQVSLTTPAITAESVNTCLLLGTSNVIDTTERMREYTNMVDVGADFGTASEEYLGAQVWFAQNPSPTNLFIGRWVNTAAAARLNGGILPAAVTVPSAWIGVTNGGFNVTFDNGTVQHVTGINLTGVTTLNGVATQINGQMTGGTCRWNANYE